MVAGHGARVSDEEDLKRSFLWRCLELKESSKRFPELSP